MEVNSLKFIIFTIFFLLFFYWWFILLYWHRCLIRSIFALIRIRVHLIILIICGVFLLDWLLRAGVYLELLAGDWLFFVIITVAVVGFNGFMVFFLYWYQVLSRPLSGKLWSLTFAAILIGGTWLPTNNMLLGSQQILLLLLIELIPATRLPMLSIFNN